MVNPNLGYSNILITTKAISIIRIMMSVLCMEIPILMSLWWIWFLSASKIGRWLRMRYSIILTTSNVGIINSE